MRSSIVLTPEIWLARALTIALTAGSSAAMAQNLDLSNLGSRGFIIAGTSKSATGASVSGAGDVNGDGRGDLIVGSVILGSGSRQTYVVFGKADNGPSAQARSEMGASRSCRTC